MLLTFYAAFECFLVEIAVRIRNNNVLEEGRHEEVKLLRRARGHQVVLEPARFSVKQSLGPTAKLSILLLRQLIQSPGNMPPIENLGHG